MPVVSVGNLTLGGTGKTPLVRWIAQWFRDRGVPAAVVSRGYGARSGDANDEALELRACCPTCRTSRMPTAWPPPERPSPSSAAGRSCSTTAFSTAASAAISTSCSWMRYRRSDSAVSFRGARSASRSKGCGGPTPSSLRADLLDPAQREELWRTIRAHAPAGACVEAVHAPRSLISASGERMPLDEMWDQPVAALCGIGNPAGFRHTLEQCGCQIAGFREFPDHHRYTPCDLQRLARWADELDVSAVFCTCKDLVKLAVDRLGDKPLWAVRIEIEFLAGQAPLESRLRRLCSA